MADLAAVQTPSLLVRLDRVRRNIDRMLQLVAGKPDRWRPHVKTAKIPRVLRLLLDAGVRRFKCATTREAAVLLETANAVGGPPVDLLVAIAHRGANLERIRQIGRRSPTTRLSMLTEDREHAAELRRGRPALDGYVDLDPGFGRSGIGAAERTRLDECVAALGDGFRGLHCYEGHVRSAEAAERRAACEAIFRELVAVAERIESGGRPVHELVTSGTPTFVDALAFEPFRRFDHQVGSGTVVYWDETSERFGLDGFGPAATVLTRVIARTGPRRATCDAGSKAVDAAAGDPCARVVDRPDLVARTPSEEHLPLAALGERDAPAAGSLLELVPRHVCPTVNLACQALLLDGADASRVEVSARGHEL